MAAKSEYKHLCGTKASRAKLAYGLEAIAARHGFVAVTSKHGREIRVEIELGPYRVSAYFNGESRVDAFLAHWFTETRSDARYPADFGAFCQGPVNQIHYGKATTYAETYAELLRAVDRGIAHLKPRMAA